MQGMTLPGQDTTLLVIVQSDSSETPFILSGDGLARSAYGHIAEKIRSLMGDKEFIWQKIRREQNGVIGRLMCTTKNPYVLRNCCLATVAL